MFSAASVHHKCQVCESAAAANAALVHDRNRDQINLDRAASHHRLLSCRSGTDIGEVSPAELKQHDIIHLSKMARAEAIWALQRRFGLGPLAGDLATRAEAVQPPLYSGSDV